jgi:Protein of unknown function (DUF1236)
MRHQLTCALLAGVCASVIAPASAADDAAPAGTAGGVVLSDPAQPAQVEPASKPALALSDQQRQALVDAVVPRNTYQPTPKEFQPEVGAAVPRTVDIHGMPPQIAKDMPALNQYMYAHLDRDIVIVDALNKKVAAVVPLPEGLVHDSSKLPDQKNAPVNTVGGLPDLPPEQRRAIYQSAGGDAQPVPQQAMLAGAHVPAGMTFQALPADAVAQAPQVQGLHYAKLQDGRLLLIDPQKRKVAGVITHEEGTRTAQGGGGAGGSTGQNNTGTSGAPTADAIRERDESGKPSAYTGPSSRAPNN